MFKKSINEEEKKIRLVFESIEPGYYFAIVRYGKDIISSKVVKTNQIEEYTQKYNDIFDFEDTENWLELS